MDVAHASDPRDARLKPWAAGQDDSPSAEARHGVSLAFLNAFFDVFVAPHGNAAKRAGPDILREMTIFANARGTTRFMSLFPAAVGPPCAFVSFVWLMPFAELLAGLNDWADKTGADRNTTFVWLFFFTHKYSLNSDGNPVRVSARDTDCSDVLQRLETTMAGTQGTLVVLDKRAVCLRRAWCLLEMAMTQQSKLTFLTPHFTELELADAFQSVPDNWDDISCHFEADKRMIMAAVEQRIGSLSGLREMVRLRLLLSPTSQKALVPLLERGLRAVHEVEDAAYKTAQLTAAAASTRAAEVDAAPAGAPSNGPAQVMLSYRVPESGVDKGGDGWTFRLGDALRDRGFTVFIAETAITAGDSWDQVIQNAVRGCQAFVAVCSATYGSLTKSRWTLREMQMADGRCKPIVPIWHSGDYPPNDVEIYLAGKQRVPGGVSNDVRTLPFEHVVDEVVAALALAKCVPSQKPGAASAKRPRDADGGDALIGGAASSVQASRYT